MKKKLRVVGYDGARGKHILLDETEVDCRELAKSYIDMNGFDKPVKKNGKTHMAVMPVGFMQFPQSFLDSPVKVVIEVPDTARLVAGSRLTERVKAVAVKQLAEWFNSGFDWSSIGLKAV